MSFMCVVHYVEQEALRPSSKESSDLQFCVGIEMTIPPVMMNVPLEVFGQH